MTMTLTSKEFDEAITLWLKAQGFNTSTHDISTRVIAGRSDGPLGTRVEITLEPLSTQVSSKYSPRETCDVASIRADTGTYTRKFGQVSDE